MHKVTGKVRAVIIALAVAGISACAPQISYHGYVPTKTELSAIKVGLDTRDTVARAIGRPSMTAAVSDDSWYYVRSKFRDFALQGKREVDREVLVIRFDKAGKVANIETFGLRDGKIVRLTRRVTTSPATDTPILKQLFGRLGQAIADQLF